MYAKLSIYLNFAGVLIWRPRMLILRGEDTGSGPASTRLAAATTRLAAATTQQHFVRLFAKQCEAFCLGLLGVS
jgi:hypothetical protein